MKGFTTQAKRITQEQARSVFSILPPDFTQEEWSEVEQQALRAGYFNLAGQCYIIIPACICPVYKHQCTFGITSPDATVCGIICGQGVQRIITTATAESSQQSADGNQS